MKDIINERMELMNEWIYRSFKEQGAEFHFEKGGWFGGGGGGLTSLQPIQKWLICYNISSLGQKFIYKLLKYGLK